MKKFLVILSLVLSTTAFAGDKYIGIEFGISFGEGSGAKTDSKGKSRYCRNRNSDRLGFVAVRYRENNIEAHYARWFHDTPTSNCNRTSNALGLGYVLSTQGKGIQNHKDTYASWTPGISYIWGDSKSFLNQHKEHTGIKGMTGTNWRHSDHWYMFNRLAIGTGDLNQDIEIAVTQYGGVFTERDENYERFVTLGIFNKELVNNRPGTNTGGGGDDPKDPEDPEDPECTSNCGDGDDDDDDNSSNGNHSGLSDGTNPGKSNQNNGGTNNPSN